MKTLPTGLQAHLDSGATTLCWCWKIVRRDGVTQGFTDHDTPLAFDGVSYAAATGFTASEVQSTLGLAVDNLTVTGALSAATLNEADLEAGLYDDADIEIWRVNWTAPAQRVLMRKGSLGEVKRGKTAFSCEVRGGAVVAAIDNRRFTVAGLDAYAGGWFSGGKLAFTSGANGGRAMEVKRHAAGSIELWQAMSETVAPGDAFMLTAGCDKQFATCKSKFANSSNFRGFPYMPGNDAVLSAPSRSQPLDGGSRYGN